MNRFVVHEITGSDTVLDSQRRRTDWRRTDWLVGSLLVLVLFSNVRVRAQDATAAYQEAMKTWKSHLSDLRAAMLEHDEKKTRGADAQQLTQANLQIKQKLEAAEAFLPELRQKGVAAYAANPDQDRELARFPIDMLKDDLQRDDYEPAYDLAQALLAAKCDDKQLPGMAGMAAFATHHFEEADTLWKLAQQSGAMANEHAAFHAAVPRYIQLWQEEAALREKEAAADDLPRVKLTTEKGDIVLELFENEAPETVGNFISLVEKGFYDGITFHRVLEHFMAQAGCPKGDGTGGPGYEIYCECYKPEHRKHFRGSLSMAKSQRRDSGGSQFFLTFVPVDHLNGLHTVFGRVSEGLPVLARLTRRDPDKAQSEGDEILKAEVVRKRDHPYVPTKTQ